MAKPANFFCRPALFVLAAGIFLLLNLGKANALDARDFEVGPAPGWTVLIEAPLPEKSSAASSAGEAFLIFDRQVNGKTDESYLHFGKQITSANGVQNGGQLQFNFDPAFQRMTIHFIHILRDGKVLDRLDKSKFKIIQQETGLERHLYNGELSAVLFLEDVRVGDVIDYAYTVKGSNPILKGRFVESFELTWTVPVQEQHYRLLWPHGRSLTIKNHNTYSQPAVHDNGSEKEYVWELHDTHAVVLETSTPSSVETFAWMQLTEFSSWQEVVDWAIPLYQPSHEELPPDLRQKIASWRQVTNPEEQASRALRFVQDEVRYLGIEIGPNSQQPNEPGIVFNRRFGDCKDKVHLFCSILADLGIESHPVLVHSYNRKTAADSAPSPYVFDHVIAQIKLDGKTIWVDPTFSYQRGPLTNLFFPDYGCGLVIAEGVKDLTVIPTQQMVLPVTVIYETFRFSNYKTPAVYEVKTVREGMDADVARAELAEQSRDEVEKAYLNHYAKLYPKIETAVPLEIQDDEDQNIITVVQTYHVSDVWELAEDKKHWTMEFYPENIFRLVLKPETSLRTFPLALNYPRHEKQITRIFLPQVYNITNQDSVVETGAVRFHRKITYSDQELTLNYDFETLTNMVAAADVPGYLQTLKKLRGLADFAIQHANGKAASFVSKKPLGPNWFVLTFSAFFTLFTVAAAFLIYYFRPPGPPPLIIPSSSPSGIGGWLILLAFGMIVRPIIVLSMVVKTAPAFSLNSWQLFNTPGTTVYQPGLTSLLMMELCFNTILMVFGVLNIVLFFQKRFAFPRVFAATLIINMAGSIMDHFWFLAIATPQQIQANKTPQIASTVMYCLIWILYVYKSERVKNTFVK